MIYFIKIIAETDKIFLFLSANEKIRAAPLF